MKKAMILAVVLFSIVVTAACGQNTESEEPKSKATENENTKTEKEEGDLKRKQMVSPAESNF